MSISRTEIVEALAAEMHNSWMADCYKNGLTTRISSITGEEQLVPYHELSETVKDFDRNGAIAFLDTLERLGFDVLPKTSDTLAFWLEEIADHGDDPANYDARETCVTHAVSAARAEGLASGYRLDPAEPEWPVAFIELPTGQVSWHLPQHPTAWDGHDTATKWARVRAYLASEAPQ